MYKSVATILNHELIYTYNNMINIWARVCEIKQTPYQLDVFQIIGYSQVNVWMNVPIWTS